EKILDEPSRGKALAAIYDREPEPRRTELLTKLWGNSTRNAQTTMAEFLPAAMVRNVPRPDSTNGRKILMKRLASLNLTDRALSLLRPVSRTNSDELAIVAEKLPEAELVRLGINDPKTDPWVLAALLPRWAELGHGSESVALLHRLIGEPNARDEAVGNLAPYLDDDLLVRALHTCDEIHDTTSLERCLIDLGTSAPEELGRDLLTLPIEAVCERETIHQLGRELSGALATELRASLQSPISRLAVTTSHKEFLGGLLLQDLEAAADELAKGLAAVNELSPGQWGAPYQRVKASLVYFVRALEMCRPEERLAVLDVGRRAIEQIGI